MQFKRSAMAVFVVVCICLQVASVQAQPKNIILFIGDGMGPEQIKAARLFAGSPMSFENLPNQGKVMTYSASSSITDSAAAATAIATGVKVNNGVISMATPGDGSELETILERTKNEGKSVGLVTTVYITHATPAGFGAHEPSRDNYTQIGEDYLTQTKPNLLFGGALYMQNLDAAAPGKDYSIVKTLAELNNLDTETVDMVSGQFGLTSDAIPYEYDGTFGELPHLSDMTAKALEILDNDTDGFFLMVEGGKIDWACHDNFLERSVYETIELSKAVQKAITWATDRTDTLIIVTADHETGGLTVTADNGSNVMPTVTWGTTGHTAADVDIFAWGANSELVSGVINNTDIINIITADPNQLPDITLVSAGSEWKYNDSGADLGTAWRETAFDDSAWAFGPAQIGYGDGDENTILSYGPSSTNKYPCYYLRRTFSVTDPAAFGALEINLIRDDGCIIYINGTEVVRSNMPTGSVSYLTYATVALGGTDESAWNTFAVDPATLVSGTNVIAVEMHQANAGSTDLSFDLKMTSDLNNPPLTPTGLTALGSDGIVALNWADNVETEGDLAGYNVYRGTAPGSYDATPIALVTDSVYDDTAASNGTTYYYVVEALDLGGLTSALSAEVSATPNVPPTVTLTSPADQSTINATAVTLTCDVSDAVGLQSASFFLASESQTVSFSGPIDVQDTYLSATDPNTNFGTNNVLTDGASPIANSLLRFSTLIGNGAGQVPLGAIIESATLEVNCTNVGTALQAYRLKEDWDEDTATWNNRTATETWSDAGADGPISRDSAAVSATFSVTGLRTIDLTAFVQDWSNGAVNNGIVLINTSTDGVQFDSSEMATPPLLTVTYRTMSWQEIDTQSLSGTNATISFTPSSLQDEQEYLWNCLVTNTSGVQAWAPVTYSFHIEVAAPLAPVLVAPAHGAILDALDATLEVNVQDPGGLPMDVTFYGREKAADSAVFTIAVLPDTQFYSASYPEIFVAQTQWIADNAVAENIVFVSHEGDIIDTASDMNQWSNANLAMSILDNVLPYGLAPGNHDMNSGDTVNYNATFPFTRYESQPWYGGHYGTANDSSYQFFSAGGDDYMVMQLQYNPDVATVAWADAIMKANPDRRVIVTTHSYMDAEAQVNYLWNDLIASNANVYFVLCGHVGAEVRRTDIVNGHPVHQMLADYQSRPNGGDGWLRLLRFVPDEDRVYVETYSPTRDEYETDANSAFTLDYTMSGYSEIATVTNVPSGSNVSAVWSNLTADTEYEWIAVATNPLGKSAQSAAWSFTATDPAGPNTPPVAGDDSVMTDEDLSALIAVLSNDTDADGDALTVGVVAAPTNGNITIEADYDITYTPFPDFNGIDSFTYLISDGRGGTDTGLVNVTVNPMNDAPIALNDAAVTNENTPVLIAVLFNDDDIDGDLLSLLSATNPINGTVSIEGNAVRFTPGTDYFGPASFSYSITDGQGGSDTALVNITVLEVNDPPTAQNDTAITNENTSILIAVLANDSDPEGDTLSLVSTTQPTNGSASIESGQIRYTPNANFNGIDSFTYLISDGRGGSAVAQVSVTVTEVNDIPSTPQNLVALADDASVGLAWSAIPDPENDLLGYIVYRSTTPGAGFAPVSGIISEIDFTDTGLNNGTTYYYHVTAVDNSAQESAPSTEVQATPAAPNYDAQVSAFDVTYGTVSGDIGSVQTLTESPSGPAGSSSLAVEYTLHTSANPAAINLLELHTSLGWTDLDPADAIHVEILRNGASGSVWEEITDSAMATPGFWTTSSPTEYVDAAGDIRVRFSDSVSVKKEKQGTLTINLLYAHIEAGYITPEPGDETPPALSVLDAMDIGPNSARITWTTDEPADSKVNYGEDTNMTSSEPDPALVTQHSVVISGLTPEKTYYYQAFSSDTSGNEGQTTVLTFTTPAEPTDPPALLQIHVESLGMEIITTRKSYAQVTVCVHDDLDNSVEGCTVTGDWYFRDSLVQSGASGVTTEGITILTSPEKNARSGDVFLFRVTAVSLPGGELVGAMPEVSKAVQ